MFTCAAADAVNLAEPTVSGGNSNSLYVLGLAGAAVIGVGVLSASNANSASQTAAALEGALAQDKLQQTPEEPEVPVAQ